MKKRKITKKLMQKLIRESAGRRRELLKDVVYNLGWEIDGSVNFERVVKESKEKSGSDLCVESRH